MKDSVFDQVDKAEAVLCGSDDHVNLEEAKREISSIDDDIAVIEMALKFLSSKHKDDTLEKLATSLEGIRGRLY